MYLNKGIYKCLYQWFKSSNYALGVNNNDVVYGLVCGNNLYVRAATNMELRLKQHIYSAIYSGATRMGKVTLYKKLVDLDYIVLYL